MDGLLVGKDTRLCLNTASALTYSSRNAADLTCRSPFAPQVRPAERDGGASCWVAGCRRCGSGRTLVAICIGICCRGDGLRGGR